MFLIDIFKGLGGFFKRIGKAFAKVFTSKQAQEVFALILENILPEAKEIVASIRQYVKNPASCTVQDIYDLYKKFGEEINFVGDNVAAKQNAVLNLATTLLDAVLPQKYATNLLHSAIELALSGLKAEEK